VVDGGAYLSGGGKIIDCVFAGNQQCNRQRGLLRLRGHVAILHRLELPVRVKCRIPRAWRAGGSENSVWYPGYVWLTAARFAENSTTTGPGGALCGGDQYGGMVTNPELSVLSE